MITQTPTTAEMEREEAELVFPAFNEDTAWEVGTALVAAAREVGAPAAINIRTPDRVLFHAALPGATPDNDHWIRRKSNLTLRRHHASMLIGEQLKAKGRAVSPEFGLDPLDYAAHGGSFPVRVRNVGVVAAITVSGLTSEEDHRLVTGTLRRYLGVE